MRTVSFINPEPSTRWSSCVNHYGSAPLDGDMWTSIASLILPGSFILLGLNVTRPGLGQGHAAGAGPSIESAPGRHIPADLGHNGDDRIRVGCCGIAHGPMAPGRPYSARFQPGRHGAWAAGTEVDHPIEAALERLASRWPGTGSNPTEATPSELGSLRAHALALLALLGDGHTLTRGKHMESSVRLAKALMTSQDKSSGQFVWVTVQGETATDPVLDQWLATLAMAETYYFSRSLIVRTRVRKAVKHAGEILNDPARRKRLSTGALMAALELRRLSRPGGLTPEIFDPAVLEVERRIAAGDDTLLLAAAQLHLIAPGKDRDVLAARVAARALDTVFKAAPIGAPAPDSATLMEAWWIADALRAAGGEAWSSIELPRREWTVAQLDDEQGAKESGPIPPDSVPMGRDPMTTAALALILEADYRSQVWTE